MKILYLGTFSNTGYGYASIHNVLSMVAANLDVVCRQIKLGEKLTDNTIIQDLLKKDASDCDTVITHCLPLFFDYSGQFKKNIGLFAYETNVMPREWVRHLACMDEVWVINNHMKKVVLNEHLGLPIKVIHHALDLNRFTRSFEGLGPIGRLKQETKAHIFYTIGEFVSRKNFEDLLKVYLTTFSPSNNTILLIKTWKTGLNAEQCKQRFTELVSFVKNNLKLKFYPRIEIVTDFWSDDAIDRLHHEADTYISCSHGEAWDIPAATSVGFGSTPIIPLCTGYLDWMQKNITFGIEGQTTPCFGTLDTLENLHTGRDTWFQPDLNHCSQTMWAVYSNKGGCIQRHQKGAFKSLERFSYENVGKIIKKALQ